MIPRHPSGPDAEDRPGWSLRLEPFCDECGAAVGVVEPSEEAACLLSVWGERFTGRLAHQWPAAADLIDRARLVAMALPLEWAVIALETNAADMAVAHIGHLAVDFAPVGTPFGSAI